MTVYRLQNTVWSLGVAHVLQPQQKIASWNLTLFRLVFEFTPLNPINNMISEKPITLK